MAENVDPSTNVAFDDEGEGTDFYGEQNVEKGGDADDKAEKLQKKIVGACIVCVFCSLAMLVVMATIALSAKESSLMQQRINFCGKIAKYAEHRELEGTGLNKTPEVVEINRCILRTTCKFDVFSCSQPCPLGFQMHKGCAASCKCATHGRLQLDIQFDESSIPRFLEQTTDLESSAFTAEKEFQLWNNNRVNDRTLIPFDIDASLSVKEREAVGEALSVFKESTCIDFVLRTTEHDYIHFQSGSGDCSAVYSRVSGKNNLNVGACYSYSHVVHVLMHALGYHHEHLRSDRDAFVAINWENVDPSYKSAFQKVDPNKYLPYSTEFDKNSVMMLDGYVFSTSAEEKTHPTMIDRETGEPAEGGHSTFTKSDLVSIASIYCSGSPENSLAGEVMAEIKGDPRTERYARNWSPWSSWSNCHETCGASVSSRHRVCQLDTGFLAYGCDGVNVGKKNCTDGPCPFKDGYLKEWGDWGECSKTCGTGIKWRNRKCSQPGNCEGKMTDGIECNTELCQDDLGVWSQWTNWEACDAHCGPAYRRRKRECVNSKGPVLTCDGTIDKFGFEMDLDKCSLEPCPLQARMMSRMMMVVPQRLAKLDTVHSFKEEATTIPSSMCDPLPNFKWFVGDFTGDGKTDTMCGESAELLKLYVGTDTDKMVMTWNGGLNCALDYMHVGDFNGDGTDDIFCKDSLLSRNLVYPAAQGLFYKYVDVGPFCMNLDDIIEVADVNGDGRADLMCRHPESGEDTDLYLSSLV